MKIVGIDYSMRCPCACAYDSSRGAFGLKNCCFYFLTTTVDKFVMSIKDPIEVYSESHVEYSCSEERYDSLAGWFINAMDNPDVVYIEGYSYNSTGKVFDIGEATGILKDRCWRLLGTKVIPVPPSQIKKYASNNGNAGKLLMYESFVVNTGVDFADVFKASKEGNPVSDIVDSFFICKFGVEKSLQNNILL